MLNTIEKLRKDDFVMCYWQASNGSFAWLVERSGELFFFVVFGMQSMRIEHWAYENDRAKVDSVRAVMSCMGFGEVPVYAQSNTHLEVLKELHNDIAIFDKTVKQNIEAMQVRQKEEAAKKIVEDHKNKLVEGGSDINMHKVYDDKEKEKEEKKDDDVQPLKVVPKRVLNTDPKH